VFTKKPISRKQRRMDDLSRDQVRIYARIEKDSRTTLNSISYINSGIKKSEMKKATKNNLGAEGIHSVSSYGTYIKRIDTFTLWCLRNYNITSLGSIKPTMVDAFLDGQIERFKKDEFSAKSVKNYLNGLLKLQEGGKKRGIKSLAKIVRDPIRQRVAAIEYRKEDYKRAGGNGGYSLEEAKIIERKMNALYGEYEAVMIRVFWEGGPRLSELRRIKFENIKFGGYTGFHIELFQANQNKNDRPRRFAISEDTYNRLLNLQATMVKNSEIRPGQNIWGRLSEDMIRYRVKKACTQKVIGSDGKQIGRAVQYSGVHDFRKALISNYDQLLIHQKEKWTKEALADAVLWHVNFTLTDFEGKTIKKNGRDWYPLNPVVRKWNYTTVNGEKVVTPILNDKEKQKKDRRFVKEELVALDIRVLRNLFESQILGHNRTNVVGEAYRTHKNTNWDKMKKINPPKRIKKPKSTN
jgi:integrase